MKMSYTKENARQESLKPDKEKLTAFANQMLDMLPQQPTLKSPAAKKLLAQTILAIQDTAKTLRQRAEEL